MTLILTPNKSNENENLAWDNLCLAISLAKIQVRPLLVRLWERRRSQVCWRVCKMAQPMEGNRAISGKHTALTLWPNCGSLDQCYSEYGPQTSMNSDDSVSRLMQTLESKGLKTFIVIWQNNFLSIESNNKIFGLVFYRVVFFPNSLL